MAHRGGTRWMLASWLALAAGCRGFDAARVETLARLQPMPLAHLVPGRFEVELTSSKLSGTFDAICAVDDSRCRLQLFPDVGGKVLDLELKGDTVTAEMPGSSYRATAPLDRATPHLALVFAAVLAELLAPVEPSRVTGERLLGDGRSEVRLRPALGSGTVIATLTPAGVIERYTITLGWIEFTLDASGELQGSRFSGWMRAVSGG